MVILVNSLPPPPTLSVSTYVFIWFISNQLYLKFYSLYSLSLSLCPPNLPISTIISVTRLAVTSLFHFSHPPPFSPLFSIKFACCYGRCWESTEWQRLPPPLLSYTFVSLSIWLTIWSRGLPLLSCHTLSFLLAYGSRFGHVCLQNGYWAL